MADWTWDPKLPGYTKVGVGNLPLSQVRGVVDVRVRAARQRMQSLADDMIAKKISTTQFELSMRAELKALHLESRMLAVGGKANMTAKDLGYVGRKLRDEYGYLSRFTASARHGELGEAMIRDRAGKYAGSHAIDEFENGRIVGMTGAGYTEKRRNAAGDGGTCEGCAAEATLGWVPIGEIGWVVGDQECDGRCRCTIDYRMADGSTGAAGLTAGAVLNMVAVQALMGALATRPTTPAEGARGVVEEMEQAA